MTEIDRSFERLDRQEKSRAKVTGYGTTKQGQALARHHLNRLAEAIHVERKSRRGDRAVWRALKDRDDKSVALGLLVSGITVCASDWRGADKDGEKNFRDMALSIGGDLTQGGDRELALKIGTWGINTLLTLPSFELCGEVLALKAHVNDFMDDVIAREIINHPLLSPLTTPPEPWTQFRKGGLPVDHWARVPLVRTRSRSVEASVRKAISAGTMQPTLDAINALQGVAHTINKPVLDFMRRLGGPLPPDKNMTAREQQEAITRLQAWEIDITTADFLACHPRFYVPLNMDFRGRIYGIPHFNFAREDHVRGLFLFADGKPIKSIEEGNGLFWLYSHLAARADGNTWSDTAKPSRLNYKYRLFWALKNLDTLQKIGGTVLDGVDPHSISHLLPDEPCQFVAACAELVKIETDSITRLPITVDASCSGLQQICAMVRADEGRYVNLTASCEAEDFYSRVAEATYRENPDLRDLMRGECDRTIVKQPAMSYFYGSRPGGWATKNKRRTPYGMTKQVAEVLKDRGQLVKRARDLAHAIYRAVEGAVPKAKEVRDFLEELAKVCAKHGKPLRWRNALGLQVINLYLTPDIKTISVALNGKRRRVNIAIGDKDEINARKAKNAVTANFTHSSDASHLQLVAVAAAKEGIRLATVHDCFGTVAPDAGRMLDIIREQFVRLHKRHWLLNEVRESARRDLPKQVALPPLPEIGNLEIDGVLTSHHAFR